MTQSPPELPLSRSGRPALEVAQQAAGLAGQIIRDRFATAKDIRFKGRADIVTDVDLSAEKAVLELLRDEFPDFGVLAEESAPIESNSGYTWVVDPLDGTRNYAMGIPHFCTVVALAQGRDIVLGITYDPVREESFVAQAGERGAAQRRPDLRLRHVGSIERLPLLRHGVRRRESRDGPGHAAERLAERPIAPFDGLRRLGNRLRRRRPG